MNREQAQKIAVAILNQPHFGRVDEEARRQVELLVALGALKLDDASGPKDDFDRLPADEQQVVIDNMSIPASYRGPAAWLEAVRASYAYADREMLAAQVYEIVQHLDLGRWQIVSHVPEECFDAAEKHRRELREAFRGLSVQNPARQRLMGMLSELL